MKRFFTIFFSLLNNLPSPEIIIGGDVNTVLDPLQDRLNNIGNIRTSQASVTLKQ